MSSSEGVYRRVGTRGPWRLWLHEGSDRHWWPRLLLEVCGRFVPENGPDGRDYWVEALTLTPGRVVMTCVGGTDG